MKYLKVKKSSEGKSPLESIEHFANTIVKCYPKSLSVEICDDEEPKFQEIKKTEIGVLDIGEGVTIGRGSWTARLHNGDPVDLVKYPEFRRFCKEVKTEWNLKDIMKGDLIEVVSKCSVKPTFGKFERFEFGLLHTCNRIYSSTDILGIRIVEVVK